MATSIPKKRQNRLKTAVTQIRMEPEVKALALQLAKRRGLSLTGLITSMLIASADRAFKGERAAA